MTDRNDRHDSSAERRGVRRLRRAAGDEVPRVGDAGGAFRPPTSDRSGDRGPAPAGPRLSHRFALSDSVDTATAAGPRLVQPPQPSAVTATRPDRSAGATDVDSPWAGRPADADRFDDLDPTGSLDIDEIDRQVWGAPAPTDGSDPGGPEPSGLPASPWESLAERDGSAPAWEPSSAAAGSAAAWEPLPDAAGPSWARAEAGVTTHAGPVWGAGPVGRADDPVSDEVGLVTGSHVSTDWTEPEDDEPSDLYAFDSGFDRPEPERWAPPPVVSADDAEEEDALTDAPVPAAPPTRSRARRSLAGATAASEPAGPELGAPTRPARRRRRPARDATRPAGDPTRPARDRDLRSRFVVGIGLLVLLIVASILGPRALVVLAAVVVLLCAAEAYAMLQRCGFRPATLLGLTATAGLMLAAYWRGETALPLVATLTFVATMVWYLIGIVEARPLANVAVTSMTVLWVGLLGSFAALMLRAPHGRGLFLGAVVVTVASDIVAYFAGRRWGRHALAPHVSPGKTVEGFVAGGVAAIVVGLVVGEAVSPWGGLEHGLLLGIAVAIFAPVGDLFESLIKRDLEVKDSGTVLAGHGGLLDRFDSVLLVLPVAYYLADYLHLIR